MTTRLGWQSRFVLTCLAVLPLLGRATAADAPSLRVGAAAVNLRADDSFVISGGIGPAYAKGQEGQLRVVAVVVEHPTDGKLAIAACDVLFAPRDIVDPALVEAARRTGIPVERMLVNATHTHHAPSTTEVHGYGRQPEFCRHLEQSIVEAIVAANDRLAGPVDCVFRLGEEKTFGANSRLLLSDNTIFWVGSRDDAVRPTGPFDPELPVLAFRTADGKYPAVIYNHSTHTIGTRIPGVRSPSFYGLAAQDLEAELGGTVAFLEGASGSTHNLGGITADEAIEHLKTAVRSALAQATPVEATRLAASKRPFEFRVRTFDEAVEDEKVASYCRKRIPQGADTVIDVFRKMRAKLGPQQNQPRTTWLQAMAIGDVAIVGVPAEYFTSLGVDIKRRSPFAHTVVAELANDWIGYLPDREGHKLGGYQTWMGLHSYAEEGTGERIADEVVAMLRELAGR